MKTLKYKIKQVDNDIITDYDGMNYYAAQEIGFDYPMDKNEIFINKNITFLEKIHAIIHEIAEAERMKKSLSKSYGKKLYWKAHRHAESVENIQCNINAMKEAIISL